MTIRLLLALVVFSGTAIGAEPESPRCENSQFSIDTNFDGGELDGCAFTSPDTVELTFQPEDQAVDDAFSWFSFRVAASDPGDLEITLRFPNAYARYWPKVSVDGQNWRRAADSDVELLDNGKHLRLRTHIDATGIWVSAQELLTQTYYDEWFAELQQNREIQTAVIGRSVQGRPILLAKTNNKTEAILLMGRQHPAEVPGAMAMREFVNLLLGDGDLAREFRERFTLLIVPLINPDGVANGHSRHSAGGVDLNRDWGPFTQPETQSVASLLDELAVLEIKPRLMLDFHATKMSPTMLFYTQLPAEPTDPLLFADHWLAAVAERIGEYEFIHDARLTSDQFNSKNYFFSRYGIPSITYELGDTIERSDIATFTPVFAEEMMREMLRAD